MKKIMLFISLALGSLGLCAMHNEFLQAPTCSPRDTDDESMDVHILQGNFEILFETFLDDNNQPALRHLATRVVQLWLDKNYRDTLISDFGLMMRGSQEAIDRYFESLFAEMFNSDHLVDLGRAIGTKDTSIFMIALQHGREDIFIRLLEYNLSCVLHGYYNIDIALNPNEMHAGKNLVHYACLHGLGKSLFILKMLGANVTAPTEMGFTPTQLVEANINLKRNIADNLILILTNKEMPEKTLNLDTTDVHFHNVILSLREYNNSRTCVRPSCSINELILAWASSTSSLTLDELTSANPTPDNIDQFAASDDVVRTPTRSRASMQADTPTMPTVAARTVVSEESFHSIVQQNPGQRQYQPQHNIWDREVNLPGQPMCSRACSENVAEKFNTQAVIDRLQELTTIEELPEQSASTSKKCCRCTIL